MTVTSLYLYQPSLILAVVVIDENYLIVNSA